MKREETKLLRSILLFSALLLPVTGAATAQSAATPAQKRPVHHLVYTHRDTGWRILPAPTARRLRMPP
jgi:hypothetical protein